MATANTVAEKIENVLLSEIHVDTKWNTRADVKTTTGASADDPAGGIEGLINSIETKGQDTPVVLRKMNPKDNHGKPYFLVCGFRRDHAVREITSRKGVKNPTIKAVIRTMTDYEARELNVRENTARDELGAGDIAFGVGAMLNLNKDMSGNQLAATLGISQPYCSKIMTILNLPQRILSDWRVAPRKLGVDAMKALADQKKEKAWSADEAWKAYEAAKEAKEGGGKKKTGPLAWIDSAVDKAKEMGTMLGTLQRDEAIDASDLDFDAHIRTLVSFRTETKNAKGEKAEVSDTIVARIADAARKAFDAALNATEETPVADAGAATNGGKKKGKKGGATAAN